MPHSRGSLIKMIFWWLWDKAMNLCQLDKKIPVLNYHSTGIFMLLFLLYSRYSGKPLPQTQCYKIYYCRNDYNCCTCGSIHVVGQYQSDQP